MSDIATTIHNERVKLSATFFNGFAIAMVAVGGIAPVISFLTEASAEQVGAARTALSLACFAAGFALHLLARSLLGRMKS